MLFEAFLGLIEAGILKRDVDGVMLHWRVFSRAESFYRALREMPPEQIGRIQMMPVSFTNELYGGRRRQTACAGRCPLRQQHDDGDAVGGCGLGWPRRRPGRQRRRRSVQFRGAGFLRCRARARSWHWNRRGRPAMGTQSNIRWNYGARDHSAGICATSSSPNTALPMSGESPTPRPSRRCCRSRIPVSRTSWQKLPRMAGKLPKRF